MKPSFLAVLFILAILNCAAQDTTTTGGFELQSTNKIKFIEANENVTIITGLRQDSSKLEVEPMAVVIYSLLKDTIVVRPTRVDYFNNGRNEKPWSQTSSYLAHSKTEVRLSIADIDKIKVKRDIVRLPTAIIGYASLISALVVAPAVSIGKDFNYKRYSNVVGYSLITMTAALTIHLTFGTKTYHLKKYKNKKIWTLVR